MKIWPLTRMANRTAARVPLPEITMSNSARRRFSRLNSTVTPLCELKPRSSVGAGYRCGVRACQTLKSPKKRFFSGACGRSSGRKNSPRPLPHIGAMSRFATAERNPFSLVRPTFAAVRHLGPVNKGFLRCPRQNQSEQSAENATSFTPGNTGRPPLKP